MCESHKTQSERHLYHHRVYRLTEVIKVIYSAELENGKEGRVGTFASLIRFGTTSGRK